MADLDERLPVDSACLDPVYVDDCPLVLSLGANANLLFVRRVPTKTQNGLIAFERVPAISLVMPWSATLFRNAGSLFEAAQLIASPVEKRALRLQ
jgi:hypothetical protein